MPAPDTILAEKIHAAYMAKHPDAVLWTDHPVRQIAALIKACRKDNAKYGGDRRIVYCNGYKNELPSTFTQCVVATVHNDGSVTIAA
jgi:hypothetical protein